MAWSITYRGFALDTTNGIAVDKVRESATTAFRESKLKGGGSALDLLRLEGRAVDVSGTIKGTSASDFKTKLAAFLAKMNDPSEGTLILDTQELPCVAKMGAIEYGQTVEHAKWSCRFVSGEKYWKSPSTTAITGGTIGTSGSPSHTETVTYGATRAETFPVWTITSAESGTSSDLDITFTNSTTSEQMKITGLQMGASDVLTLDPNSETVYFSTSSSGASKPPRRIDGIFWSLSGASVAISVTINTTTFTNGFTVGATYYNRYYSFGE